MATRHSRTPTTLSYDEQRQAVASADAHPGIRTAIEALCDCKWDELTFQQKLANIQDLERTGRVAGSLAGAARGVRDLEREGLMRGGQISAEDQVRLYEDQVRDLKERIAGLESEKGAKR